MQHVRCLLFTKEHTLASVAARVIVALLLGLFASDRGISAAQTIEWVNNEHGKFVMDLAENGGLAFVATEDRGVSVLYLATGKVERLQHPQMPEGDGAYAVLPSETGTWIGYGKSGVGLLSGSSFKLYAWPVKPVGKRIFDIKERKSDGSIWICSEIGLTIIPSESVADSSKWILLSQAEGVNGAPLTDVHFYSDGTACVISQTNDITLIDSQGRVRPMSAPPLSPGDQLSQCQGAPTCAMIDTSDILWLGCTWGAVFTTDRGKTWRSLLKQQGYQPQDAFAMLPNSNLANFEKDPYCASLAELSPGWYCYGLRSGNPIYFSSKSKNAAIPNIALSGFVKTQLAVNDDTLMLGCYGEGLVLIQAGMPRKVGNAAKIKQGNANSALRLPESKPLPDSDVEFERITTKTENIALDEDDAHAIICRRILREHPFLKEDGRVLVITAIGDEGELRLASNSVPKGNKRALTSMAALYELSQELGFNIDPSLGNKQKRPTDEILDKAYDAISARIDDLLANAGNIRSLLTSTENARDVRAPKDNEGAGHPFMRPLIQISVAKAARQLIESGKTTWPTFLECVSGLDWKMSSAPWCCVTTHDGTAITAQRDSVDLLERALRIHIRPSTKTEIKDFRKEFKNIKNYDYPISAEELEQKLADTSPA